MGALEGFCLALDTDGKNQPAQQGSKKFVQALSLAQAKTKAEHQKIPPFPNKPKGVQVVSANKERVQLNWMINNESFLSGYKVYRQDPLTNTSKAVSGVLTSPVFVDNKPLAHNARYTVVALNGE